MRRRMITVRPTFPLLLSALLASSALLATAALPGGAAAQVAWEAPPMIAPGSPSGLSVLLWDADPSDDLGVMAMWRQSAVPVGLGLRGGLAEEPGGDLAGMFGLDVSGSLGSLDEAGNAGVVWWAGAGLGFGDDLLVSLPAGITVGWRVTEDAVTFSPYVGGHVAFDILTGPNDDLDLEGAVDLGIDLTFSSGFAVRFGASVGGRESLAVGLRFPS